MDMDQVMHDLERASQLVLAPPNQVTHDQRQAAETVILLFRKTKLPYNICKNILEKCKIDYVLFQAATTIQESVIREWCLLSAEDIESLRSFLLRYITQHISLQSYVREQILQTVAVILKRGTIDNKGASLDGLFQDVTQLISSGNVTMQLVACSMLTALLNEYSSSNRTSSVGFTWEFHTKCKKAFEVNDLQKVFLFSLQVLNEIEKQASPLPRETTAVLNRFLGITEQVLCWEFTPKTNMMRRNVGSFDINQSSTLKPHEKWRDTLLEPTFVQLMFKIHKKARHNSEMAHHTMQCLTQLASLNGPIFPDDKARTQYMTTFIETLLEFLISVDLQDYECLGVASIFKNVVMMFPSICLSSIPSPLYSRFIENLRTLTCSFGREAALEEEMHKEDTLHMEAYEKVLETWMELLTTKKDNVPMDILKVHAVHVFNSYVQCHISPPDGCRVQNTLDSQPDCDEIDEVEEDDRDRFSDQLCSVGALGRLTPENSISVITRAMEDRITRLHGQLQRIHQCRVAAGGLDGSFDNSLINILHEDLHWLILVTAHVLTEEAEGETPMIPAEIMQFSIKQSVDVDLTTTLKVLASPSDSVDTIPGASTHADHVIRLISAVFRLCEVQKQTVSAKMVDVMSPQVTSSVMWFLRRWSRSYLLPDENYYHQVSKALWAGFGRDTEGAQWTVSFLLDKIVTSLMAWGSEEATMTDILQLLISLLDNKTRAVFITKCEGLWKMVRSLAHGEEPFCRLPAKALRLLYKAFVLGGAGIQDDNMKIEYWKLVLQTLQEKFYHVVCVEGFTKICYTPAIKDEVTKLLESLCGVAKGSRVDNIDKIFDFLQPLIQHCVTLLDLYHNHEDIVPLILEMLSEVVQRQLCFLNGERSKKLYEVCLSAIQTYSKHNTGKRIKDASNEEEDRYVDILIVMELLTNILSKDFVDFGEKDDVPKGSGEQVIAVDVVLFGLNTIIPLMTEDLLRFPSLCSQYFKLVTFLAEIHPDKFTALPEELFKTMMVSIEMGLVAYGVDITKLCLESIYSLGTHVFQNSLAGTQMHSTLQHFLKIVFRILLLENFNMDLLDTASTTLFCLICCHQDQYRQLVNEILESHIDQLYKDRLLQAFNNLTPPTLPMTISRHNKLMFMENFNHFLINVRGFLCVK